MNTDDLTSTARTVYCVTVVSNVGCDAPNVEVHNNVQHYQVNQDGMLCIHGKDFTAYYPAGMWYKMSTTELKR